MLAGGTYGARGLSGGALVLALFAEATEVNASITILAKHTLIACGRYRGRVLASRTSRACRGACSRERPGQAEVARNCLRRTLRTASSTVRARLGANCTVFTGHTDTAGRLSKWAVLARRAVFAVSVTSCALISAGTAVLALCHSTPNLVLTGRTIFARSASAVVIFARLTFSAIRTASSSKLAIRA